MSSFGSGYKLVTRNLRKASNFKHRSLPKLEALGDDNEVEEDRRTLRDLRGNSVTKQRRDTVECELGLEMEVGAHTISEYYTSGTAYLGRVKSTHARTPPPKKIGKEEARIVIVLSLFLIYSPL